MKILYLCPDLGIPVLGRKGASAHVRGLACAFRRSGNRVTVVAPLLNKSPWEEPAKFEVPIMHIPPGADTVTAALGLKAFNDTLGAPNPLPGEVRRILYNRELARQLKERFESDPPDFIYERASLYATAGVSLARKLSLPLLIELNAPLAVEQSAYRSTAVGKLAAQAERWMLSRADAVLVVSAPLRDYAVSLGLEAGRVHLLPNGVDPALFQPRPRDPMVRARWGLGEGPVIGFVSGLRRWHGADVLPILLERLVRRYKDLRLMIVGDGPLRRELERDFEQRGLMRSAIFTGALLQEEVAELMCHFDVALAPYPNPQHAFYFSPLKLFEYMACGVPVAAAALEQIKEVVRDGESGLLYPPGELDALTAACDQLLADPALRQRLGEKAAKEVRSRYTWDRNAARVEELARSLISARGVNS